METVPLIFPGGTVSNNNAASSGGGVYVHDKTAVATISNATISGNTSPWASGIFIWNEGSVTINENTLITENQTTGNNHGGGIYLLGGTLKMTGGTVSKRHCTIRCRRNLYIRRNRQL